MGLFKKKGGGPQGNRCQRLAFMYADRTFFPFVYADDAKSPFVYIEKDAANSWHTVRYVK